MKSDYDGIILVHVKSLTTVRTKNYFFKLKKQIKKKHAASIPLPLVNKKKKLHRFGRI